MALRRTPMKPGKGLERRTPLRNTRSTETYERPPAPPMNLAAAAVALTRQAESAALPRREHAPVPEPTPAAARPKNTGFPTVVRQTILDRDHMRCQRCGRNIDTESGPGYSLQHRDNRAMGGSRDPRINLPSNGLTLCGSATTACHGEVECGDTRAAERAGYAVQSWADPETVPVKTFNGWVLLTNHGTAWPTAEPPNGDAHTVARRKGPLA